MRKTYVTKVPDKAGVFLCASRIIAAHGGNIVRANYNKAVDTHTLFVEVAADEESHQKIAQELLANGFLTSGYDDSKIMMIVLKLPNQTGGCLPALEVLARHQVNISYVSTQENGTPNQYLKMGILVENPQAIKALLEELSAICEVRILDYEVTDRLLDGTVFYVTFTNEMRDILNLSPADAHCVLIRANKLMQILDDQDKSSLQTFDYIRRFAQFVVDHRGSRFDAKVSTRELAGDLKLTVIEPPCGSNTYILEQGEKMLFVDGGYGCYREEMLHLLRETFPGFDQRRKEAVITHADMDHTGLSSIFEKVYMSRSSYENFLRENRGEKGFREENPKHTPYFGLSEIITGYTPPALDNMAVIGGDADIRGRLAETEYFDYIGSLSFGGRRWDCYEGPGGHVKGEIVIVCEELKLLFSGDIYVNVKGITPEQKEFNRLAPFLLTGVDEDPALSRRSREALVEHYHGYLFCPGHGPVQTV